jgi:hypothetical protein
MSILVAASIGLAVLAGALVIVACLMIGAMNRLTDAIGKLNLEVSDKGKGGVKFMGPTSLPFGKAPAPKYGNKKHGKRRDKNWGIH